MLQQDDPLIQVIDDLLSGKIGEAPKITTVRPADKSSKPYGILINYYQTAEKLMNTQISQVKKILVQRREDADTIKKDILTPISEAKLYLNEVVASCETAKQAKYINKLMGLMEPYLSELEDIQVTRLRKAKLSGAEITKEIGEMAQKLLPTDYIHYHMINSCIEEYTEIATNKYFKKTMFSSDFIDYYKFCRKKVAVKSITMGKQDSFLLQRDR